MYNCCINNHFNDTKLWCHLGIDNKRGRRNNSTFYYIHICICTQGAFCFILVIYEIPHDCAHLIFSKCLFVLILFFSACNAWVIMIGYSILHMFSNWNILYFKSEKIGLTSFLRWTHNKVWCAFSQIMIWFIMFNLHYVLQMFSNYPFDSFFLPTENFLMHFSWQNNIIQQVFAVCMCQKMKQLLSTFRCWILSETIFYIFNDHFYLSNVWPEWW